MSFHKDTEHWWYVCDVCGKVSVKVEKGVEPPEGLRAWKVQGMEGVHTCPNCRDAVYESLERMNDA
jgi:hypothetical protein